MAAKGSAAQYTLEESCGKTTEQKGGTTQGEEKESEEILDPALSHAAGPYGEAHEYADPGNRPSRRPMARAWPKVYGCLVWYWS